MDLQKKRRKLYLKTLACIMALFVCIIFGGCGGPELIAEEVTVEAGEPFAFSVTDFFDVTEEKADDFTVDS